MDKLQTTDVYVPVDCNERLPEIFENVQVVTNYKKNYIACLDSSGEWDTNPFMYDDEYPTHWLEKKVLHTVDELKELISSAFAKGMQYEQGLPYAPDKTECIKSILP